MNPSDSPATELIPLPRQEATPHAQKRTRRLSLIHLLRPHWKALSVALLAVAAQGIADVLDPWPLKILLDHVIGNKRMPERLANLAAYIPGQGKEALLNFTALAVIGIAVISAISSYTEKYFTTSVGQWVMHDLRRMLYHHIQRLSLSWHDQKRTGDLISRVTSDIDAIQSFITSALLGVVVNLLTLIGMIGVMFYLNWRFTLIALSVAPVLFAVVYTFTHRIKKASRDVRKKEGQVVSVIEEVLSSMRVVKAFAREDYEQRRFEQESLESVETALRARSLKAKLSPLVEVIVAAGTCLVIWYGARLVLAGALTPGVLIVFFLYLGKMYKPMRELSKMTDTFSKAAVGFERIREVLETERQVRDMPHARVAPAFRGRIEFEHVDFGYNPERMILKDLNLTIEPGQVAAIVGPTGAGKTTIISLIPRFYDPLRGTVKIDGTDVRRFKQRSLRQQISFVLQETLLFRAPVWHNIAYGKPEATRDEIIRAAQLANAHEFIEKMPEGYDTMIGERGVTLSGGQRQRIAIARAIIRNSPILILDEPTSGLDAASEELVFEALNRLMADKTCIVIAHRLATVRRADVIFVLRDGTVVEQGTHEQLLERGGLYSELYEIQFRGEENEVTGVGATKQ
ncbi:MAG TPA: ABC transporter ATP-binding protein [Blastocatellia bacterium]|nr:ABC transporter ATP-binding protein [Blastocatellia bacterium]